MSMTDKELVLQVLQDYSRDKAVALQADQVNMKAAMNMSQRKVGENDGFLCRSTAGHVVRLIGSYDSDVWPGEPEELPAQWKFVWSKDPKKARPFVAISTSPYNTDECCIYPAEDGVDHVYRSGQDGNVWPPRTVNIQWTDLGTVEEVMGNV